MAIRVEYGRPKIYGPQRLKQKVHFFTFFAFLVGAESEEESAYFAFFASIVGAETGEENAFLTFFVFTVSAQTGT